MAGRGSGGKARRSLLAGYALVGLVGGAPGPASSRPELFPQDSLGPGERVLFATRPSFPAGFWGRTLLLGIVLLVLLLPVATSGIGYLENPFAWFLIGVVLFFLLVVYLQWRHALYALTNQRLVRISGWRGRGVESIAIGDVLSVNSGSSSGGAIMFRYRVPWSTGPQDPSGFRVKTFAWPAVSNPLEAAAWVQKMLTTAQAELRVESRQEVAVEQVAGVTVTCPYCGGRSALALFDSRRPVCPFCSAPLTLPPVGGSLPTT